MKMALNVLMHTIIIKCHFGSVITMFVYLRNLSECNSNSKHFNFKQDKATLHHFYGAKVCVLILHNKYTKLVDCTRVCSRATTIFLGFIF